MSTTLLQVELVVIGLECTIWMSIWLVNATSYNTLILIGKILEKTPITIFLLGIFYIIGMIGDRGADMFFYELERSIRRNSGLKVKSSLLLWDKDQKKEFFIFIRSKIRVLRSTIFNLPLIGVGIDTFIFKYTDYSWKLIFAVTSICILLTVVAYKGYIQLLGTMYKKAKTIEMESD